MYYGLGDYKFPGLIGRTFFYDGLQIRRDAWRGVDLLQIRRDGQDGKGRSS